jgi:phosphomethylpyrimidine synthase
MTQLESARRGTMTSQMERVCAEEGLASRELLRRVADGLVVVLANNRRANVSPVGVGEGLRTNRVPPAVSCQAPGPSP